jgi:hypothetical protein
MSDWLVLHKSGISRVGSMGPESLIGVDLGEEDGELLGFDAGYHPSVFLLN